MVTSILIKATVIVVLALAATRLTRRSRAAVRHMLLAAAFAVLLILPIVSMLAPSIRVPMLIALPGALDAPDLAPFPDAASSPALTSSAATTPQRSRAFQWPAPTDLVLAAWLLGACVCLLPVVAGLWQVRVLRRAALPWIERRSLVESLAADAGVRCPVEILLHESLPSPMTCGVRHPAIVLPADAPTWGEQDARRAIVHELEHIARADWLSQALARTTAACYWFHPIVWLAWRQLTLEAERACDDAVLRRSEATAYADQLVGLARRLSSAIDRTQLAMAGRKDLATRVGAVLDDGQRRGRAGVRRVALTGTAAAVLVMAISPLRIVAVQEQVNRAAPVARFDAASVRPCNAEEDPAAGRGRGTAGGTNASTSPGRMHVPCVSLQQLIYLAYASYGANPSERMVNDDFGSGSNATKVRGGPAWVHSHREGYTVEAVAQGASERTVLLGTMLRTLLEDRFQLKIHRESEQVPMYALTVAKAGSKLQPMKDGDCDADRSALFNLKAGKPMCGSITMRPNGPNVVWTLGGFEVQTLAGRLSPTMGRHVIDRTGITGKFVIRLEFHPDESTVGIDRRDLEHDESVPQAASILTALDEQLGLKLEPIRAPREFIVIDRIERPLPQ
jgi:uncharacterized protein (TIGR03435 family)